MGKRGGGKLTSRGCDGWFDLSPMNFECVYVNIMWPPVCSGLMLVLPDSHPQRVLCKRNFPSHFDRVLPILPLPRPSPVQLRGLSESFLKAREGTEPDTYVITLKYPDIEPILVSNWHKRG